MLLSFEEEHGYENVLHMGMGNFALFLTERRCYGIYLEENWFWLLPAILTLISFYVYWENFGKLIRKQLS